MNSTAEARCKFHEYKHGRGTRGSIRGHNDGAAGVGERGRWVVEPILRERTCLRKVLRGTQLQKWGKHEKHGLGASRSVQCDNGSNRALYNSGEVAVGERDDRRGGQQGSKSGSASDNEPLKKARPLKTPSRHHPQGAQRAWAANSHTR